jgi:hypothetical protein
MHYIRIGKLGHIARMLNPKNRNGPVACTAYPTKPGESCRKAITAQERIEASILTHTTWMSDPPERKTVTLLILLKMKLVPMALQLICKRSLMTRLNGNT